MVEDMIRLSLTRLKAYIESEQWKGYDPYDALNSPLLKPCSFGRVSIRTLYTQILKKIPVNTRKILMINKGRNPKAMGLFLASYLVMYRTTEHLEYLNKVRFFMDWLLDNSSDGYAGYCWGYNFPWQSGAFFLPAGEPTVVNTCF
ncbi:delta-aminolevulinic acid dehydratase, partial [Candidatus Poribacteria bacterium]|nr:delta-aminolevulinic acid dehydratase [Candidatus Poribacteria bacterium]